jgi:Domain of unknown function (DUF309)
VRLFNEGRWFEAHEVLEDAWRAEPTEVRRLYQGLLQVGVGLHHASRGNLRGALSLLDRGIARLEPFRPRCLGLDVERLLRDAGDARRALAAPGGLEGFRPSEAPRAALAPVGRSVDVDVHVVAEPAEPVVAAVEKEEEEQRDDGDRQHGAGPTPAPVRDHHVAGPGTVVPAVGVPAASEQGDGEQGDEEHQQKGHGSTS